jgi:integrase
MAAQKRMLFPMDHPAQERFALFDKVTRHVAASTRAAYWAAYMALQKIFEIAPSASDRKTQRYFEAKSWETPQTNPTTPLTSSQLNTLLERDDSPMATMIAVAYELGQRLGDMLQLHYKDVVEEAHRVLVTVRRGKVVPRIGPFTLALPKRSPAARRLMALWRLRKDLFLLSEHNSQEERTNLAKTAHKKLSQLDQTLGVRSVRKGGLMRLAGTGKPLSTILLFSRHATTQMLYKYLGEGRYAEEHLNLQMDTITSAMGASTTTH